MNLDKARKSREKELVFDCPSFSIYTIPLNYMIEYKVKVKDEDGELVKLIPQYQYSSLDWGLEKAKEQAVSSLDGYYRGYKAMMEKA